MNMSLSSLQLDAFLAVARAGTFSRAAKEMHLTQSALSQRIINLEQDLEATLFVRDPAGLRLTPSGEDLLRYCQIKESLEQEAVARLARQASGLRGTVRIATSSSLQRSILLPALAPILSEHPDCHLQLFSRELRDLNIMLIKGEADYIVTNETINRDEVEQLPLGNEVNILIEPRHGKPVADVFFDHDPEDQTTRNFFRAQAPQLRRKNLQRSYLDEIYALIDAVGLGLGRAVVPKHLILENRDVRIVKGYEPIMVPVYLAYFKQPYYGSLHQLVVKTLQRRMSQLLG